MLWKETLLWFSKLACLFTFGLMHLSLLFFCLIVCPQMLWMLNPFFIFLYGKQPNLIVLRVFWSQCFPYLYAYTKHKLQPRSIECVFLGYASKQYGYLSLHCYIGRHVKFYEKIFPLSSCHLVVPQRNTVINSFLVSSSLIILASKPSFELFFTLVSSPIHHLLFHLLNQLLFHQFH